MAAAGQRPRPPLALSARLRLLTLSAALAGRGAKALLRSSADGGGHGTRQPGGGPVVSTSLGPILGAHEDGFDLFSSIPYAEPAERFQRPRLRQTAWGPGILNATAYRPACIGSGTAGHEGESEDCLNANIWAPKGERHGLPVIVYFHGGMNQHGCGHDPLRQGDLIVQSAKFPTIFVSFDFRLGVFGWISGGEGFNVSSNLGFLDQQVLLQWVQRHIAAFGGDPGRVTLMGQSEGATNIFAHLAAPGSAGLFHRCTLFSPPADVWSRSTNRDRTLFMVERLGCGGKKQKDPLDCLRKVEATKLWGADWVSTALASPGSKDYMHNLMGMFGYGASKHFDQTSMLASQGWHPIVDGDAIPDEPRKLIAEGRWNKVPILVTTTKNESIGVLPDFPPGSDNVLNVALQPMLQAGELRAIKKRYRGTLNTTGIRRIGNFDLGHQILTDKLWMCDLRALARDVARSGGEARLGMFWHSPKYDRVGVRTNRKCIEGASCHATDMLYALPQGRGKGIHGHGMEGEAAFAQRYSNEVLSFIHGQPSPWVAYDATEPVTFIDAAGPRIVRGYRREQCEVLDASVGKVLPPFMHLHRI